MKLTVNGEPRDLPDGTTVATLVDTLGLKGRAVAVEVNKEVVPKRRHSEAPLREGDHVEVVTLVGGG
jgi:sulfur carrier protein